VSMEPIGQVSKAMSQHGVWISERVRMRQSD
jgi:hypothetical protein